MLRRGNHIHVKICGLTRLEDARAAVDFGADFLGLIFYPKSPRYLTPEKAADLLDALRKGFAQKQVRAIGVFVNSPPDEIAEIAKDLDLAGVQLHGSEPPECFEALRARLPGLALIRALRVKGPESFNGLEAFLPLSDAFLFDAYSEGAYGGTGHCFAHELAIPWIARHPIILAGGLNPETVGEAILLAHPFAVDASSGLEISPGVKSLARIRAFFHAVRSAEGQPGAIENILSSPDHPPNRSSQGNLLMNDSAGSSPLSGERIPRTPRDCPRPDANGHYGPFGGRYVPETLMPALLELEAAYREASSDKAFQAELNQLLSDYAGRPTPLYFARHFSETLGNGVRVYLKREDLLHTGAHKINNTLGQGLLARRLGKRRVIAETGAGQHGVATATAAALLGLECEVFMGEEDIHRQELNVFRMKLLGAKVTTVFSGSRTLKDATNEALRDWMARCEDTHYIIGSVVGPHPFPMMVRDFQSVIGRETRRQALEREGRLPDHIAACVGGGSNSMGMFHAFFDDESVALWGVEAAGEGISSGRHAASLGQGEIGVFHGSRSLVLQTEDGQITPAHSISAGLDYPGVGPEHSYYAACGRARYVSVTDAEALEAVKLLCQTEGILPALESAHAAAHLMRLAPALAPGAFMVLCLSGRGDKDVYSLQQRLKVEEA